MKHLRKSLLKKKRLRRTRLKKKLPPRSLLKKRHLQKSPLMTRKLSKQCRPFQEKPAYAGFFYDENCDAKGSF
jgi:hypothetical protein